MKHFREIICVKSGKVTSAYTDEIFDVKKGDSFAVVGDNNATQMCIKSVKEYGETIICYLHNGMYDIGTMKDSEWDCHDSIKLEEFAEFDFID